MAEMENRRSWLSACGDSGECVEVCFDGDQVLMRGSRDPQGPMLAFTIDEWQSFRAAILTGELSAPSLSTHD
jgi:Domain of unknown function (DUF397)